MKTIWKTITIKNITLDVSNSHQIKYKNKVYTQSKINGYLTVYIYINGRYKSILIHRAVAIGFIPNPNNLPVVNHINGVKTDNSIDNLEWVTIADNTKHACKTGLLTPRGEGNGMAKITKEIALDIYHSTMKRKDLAAKYNIGIDTVKYIKHKKRWAHIHE